jgi:hypothetical protein
MPNRVVVDKLSIYIPQSEARLRLVERLIELGEKRDRPVN